MKKLLRVTAAYLAVVLACAPAAGAQESSTPPSTVTRQHAPDTDSCPHSLVPPEPMTTSEALAPGASTPTPLPVAVAGNCGISAPDGFRVPDELLASSWIVVDLDTREIVAQKDPHGRYRPASIIKVLLALVVIDRLDLDRQVTVSAESAAQEGSAVGIGAGGTYTIEQLLDGLLLASGNDAAHALAQELGGDERTLELIADEAARIGTTDTRVMTYSGLDAPGNSSSAYDLGLIYTEAFSNETFARIIATEKIDFPGYDDRAGYELWNDNGLFLNDPDGIGGKTGYTDDANHTFVGALDRDGRRLAAVILDTTVDSARAWRQAQLLLDEAYLTPAGNGIGELVPIATTTSTPTPTLDTTGTANTADTGTHDLPAIGIGVVTAVSVVLVIVATVVRRGGRR